MRVGLARFIAVSLLVHAAFFIAPWPGREAADGAVAQGGAALAVRLAPATDAGVVDGADLAASVDRDEDAVPRQGAAQSEEAADPAVTAGSRGPAHRAETTFANGIESAGGADAGRPARWPDDRAPVVAEGWAAAGSLSPVGLVATETDGTAGMPRMPGAEASVDPDETSIADLAGSPGQSMPAPPAPAPAARSGGDLAGEPAPLPPAAEAGALATGEIASRLSEAVQTHFHYPALARRRGLEGEVVIGLRVEGDGRLTAIRVVSSSGHRLLDSAALESLNRAERLADARGVPVGGLELTLPVRYRLVDA